MAALDPRLGVAPLAVGPRDPRVPPWVPGSAELVQAPEEVRAAAAEIVQPIYERFVLEAADPMERAIGLTVAHLLWLEVLDQIDMRKEYVTEQLLVGLPGNRHAAIDQHLRVLQAKVQVGHLLVRLREFRERAARQSPVPLSPVLGKSPAAIAALPQAAAARAEAPDATGGLPARATLGGESVAREPPAGGPSCGKTEIG